MNSPSPSFYRTFVRFIFPPYPSFFPLILTSIRIVFWSIFWFLLQNGQILDKDDMILP